MTFLETWGMVALGIAASVVVPIIRQHYPKPSLRFLKLSTIGPYLYLLVGSVVTAPLIIAYSGDLITTWKTALLAGYAWDATLQKLLIPQSDSDPSEQNTR